MPEIKTKYDTVAFENLTAPGDKGKEKDHPTWKALAPNQVEYGSFGYLCWDEVWGRYNFEPTDNVKMSGALCVDIAAFLKQLNEGEK